MNTTLSVNFNNTSLKMQVISAMYKERQAWVVNLEDGRELVLAKDNDEWKQMNEGVPDSQLVQTIGESIDKAIEAGKGPFVTQEINPPPAELF